MKVAYCTGFWCTNIGNGFFSLGVEYVLKKVLGEKNVTIVSDIQTYTTSFGKRLYFDKNQLEYLSSLDVDYVVLAGPVISRYFLQLWKDILNKLKQRGVGYIILSAGAMKLNDASREDIKAFFESNPPYILSSRDEDVYHEFGPYAEHSYNGICFSFFAPDFYTPTSMDEFGSYVVYNFDKLLEPEIWVEDNEKGRCTNQFLYLGDSYKIKFPKILGEVTKRTDRFTDALIYALSIIPAKKHANKIGNYRIVRTDHRFHPHFRSKIYQRENSFVSDLPFGYLNLYANAEFVLSDRVHACAVALAYGRRAMLFAQTKRAGLLKRVGAYDISERLVELDMYKLDQEKENQINWLRQFFDCSNY